MANHTILVAITVNAESREKAETYLHLRLPNPGDSTGNETVCVDSWWVAEDERFDRSDCDSAVFVKPGSQAAATALLRQHGLAY